MKQYLYVLGRVLEFASVTFVCYYLVKLQFWLMNLASTVGNTVGFLAILTIFVSYGFYIFNYIKRIINHSNQ